MASKNWSDYFAESFAQSFGIAQRAAAEKAFEEWKIKQEQESPAYKAKVNLLNTQADLYTNGMPVYTFGENGIPQLSGTVPKGAKIVPPASMMTPQEKAQVMVDMAAQKDQATRDLKLQGLTKAFDFFEEKINQLPGDVGFKGRVKGLGLAAQGVLQTNPEAAAYMADVEGLRSQIARGLGEVGNLSEYEQKYAKNLLPQITDNLETRAAKIQNFRDYVNKKLGFSFSAPQSDMQVFNIGGKSYNIPKDKVDAFKKAKGLK